MKGNSNWKPNEQGGDSLANNASDWRSQHEPDLRKRIIAGIIQKLKKYFPHRREKDIKDAALKFESKVYGMATDKDDYRRKISERIMAFCEKYRIVQANNMQYGSSVNGPNTQDPVAQALSQGQSLPTSLPYTQTPTSQQWFPQNNIQSNPNILESSGLPTQVPITGPQNLNIHMGEGVLSNLLTGSQRKIQGRQQLLPQAQQQQQQHHQQSLLKQTLAHHTSFPQSSALSSLPSSGQQNSPFFPRHQSPTQRLHSCHQQQMAVPSQEQTRQERKQVISQLMNGQDTQQNHLTSRQNNGEQQGALTVSSSQQNNIASFQEMSQQSNNLHNMHQQQRLYSHSNNASALPSQHMPGCQSGNFNVQGSSLLGTQGLEVGHSQPIMLQQHQPQHLVQQQQPQNRILQKHLDNTQRFQEAGSLRQTQNLPDQQNQPYQLQRAPPENPSTSQDSTGKTVDDSGGDWQEETYQKIKALKDKYLLVLSKLFQRISDKLLEIESHPQQQMMLYDPIRKLKAGKSTLGRVLEFLNVHRNSISETHRDSFSLFEEHVLRFTKNRIVTRRPMQHQQGQFQQTALQSQSGHQVQVSQSLDNDQMNPRLMPSHQNGSQTAMPCSLQTRPNMEPNNVNNIMSSSGDDVLPSLKQNPASNPQVVHSNTSPVQRKQFHQLPMQHQLLQRQQQQPQTNQQQLQVTNSETNDLRVRQGVNTKAGLLQQDLSLSQGQIPKPMASPARMSNSQTQNYSSPQLVDQQILPTTCNNTGTSSQSGGWPFVAPSPVPSFDPSPNLGDPENPISVESPVSHDYQIQTEAQEHPLSPLPPQPDAERPIDRLIKAFQSSSPESLAQSVSEMSSVISLSDRLAGSVHSIGGSRARLGEDLSARTEQGETNPNKRFKRLVTALPLDIPSQTDSYKQFSSLESEADSTASSASKLHKTEAGCVLMQEIKEINGRLVETVVNICNKEFYPGEGTIVTCSYVPVALSPIFEAHYYSGHITQIQPLRLLVPPDYPYSPVRLENFTSDGSLFEYEDLSARTRSRFSLSMRELSEPMSLKEIAQVWDDCARATMVEYAERHGGGTFSSKYGHWEHVC